MIVIAENLNARNSAYIKAVAAQDKKEIVRMAGMLTDAGAEMLNIQCSADGSGDEKTLPFVVETLQEKADTELCIDSRNAAAIKKAVPICKKPPLINFVSADENEPTEEIIEIASRYKAGIVLRASRGTVPVSLEAKMQILYDLIEQANSADIPNERIFADPSVVHLGGGIGQDHLVNAHRCILVLKEIMDPPLKTVSWVSNVSTGTPQNLKSMVNAAFLTYLCGAGLDAAMIDVLDPFTRKFVYLIKSFRDEIVFSPAAIS